MSGLGRLFGRRLREDNPTSQLDIEQLRTDINGMHPGEHPIERKLPDENNPDRVISTEWVFFGGECLGLNVSVHYPNLSLPLDKQSPGTFVGTDETGRRQVSGEICVTGEDGRLIQAIISGFEPGMKLSFVPHPPL